jgi:hypothetical protein
MLLEAVTFVVASLVHSGALLTGYEHREARIAEGVISTTLVLGLALTWVRPAWTGAVGLAAQAFAFVGTTVGLLMIAVGVGPRTGLDLVYHAAIVMVLVWGLSVAARARGRAERVTTDRPPVR